MELLEAITGNLSILYACASPSKLLDSKLKEPAKLKKYAEFGWYTTTEGADHETVEFVVNKLISAAQEDIADGNVPATCGAYDGASPSDIADDLESLLNLFLNQSELLTDPDLQAFILCPETGCEEPDYVSVPAKTFGQLVAIIARTNNQPFPDPDFPTIGPSLLYDVVPATAVANNAWTRCIKLQSISQEESDKLPDESTIFVLRQDENGEADILPTTVGACPGPTSTGNFFMRGAHKVFAGFPFFPKELHAYLPPRTFGGSSDAASPHFLTSFDQSNPFDALCLLTDEYSPPTAGAGCTKLVKARDCDAVGDDACVIRELESYIGVVSTGLNSGKLTQQQADDLTTAANALMPESPPE